jgi:hypothetical protein
MANPEVPLEYIPLEDAAKLVHWSLVANIAASVALCVSNLEWQSGSIWIRATQVPIFQFVIPVVLLVYWISFFATPILFLSWQFLALNNLRWLHVERAKSTPEVLWSWFVPVLNLVVPYMQMCDLHKASVPLPGAEWEKRGVPFVIPVWWVLWLLTMLWQFVFWTSSTDFLLMKTAVYVICAVLLMHIVTQITKDQRRRHHMFMEHARKPDPPAVAAPAALKQQKDDPDEGLILTPVPVKHELEH